VLFFRTDRTFSLKPTPHVVMLKDIFDQYYHMKDFEGEKKVTIINLYYDMKCDMGNMLKL
jgi:hypothetical protein